MDLEKRCECGLLFWKKLCISSYPHSFCIAFVSRNCLALCYLYCFVFINWPTASSVTTGRPSGLLFDKHLIGWRKLCANPSQIRSTSISSRMLLCFPFVITGGLRVVSFRCSFKNIFSECLGLKVNDGNSHLHRMVSFWFSSQIFV